MRYLFFALAVVLMSSDAASAQSCRELQRACEMKEQLGERGQGNCRRFREQCQQQPDCAALRQACMFKDELGERGAGNCRTYRAQCRG
jgi:hypothetical protein